MTDVHDGRISFLSSLRAVPGFRRDPVPREVVDDILEVARWSGSASNRQPGEIVVVRNPETLGALDNVEGYDGHLEQAPPGIVLTMAGERAGQEAFDEGRSSGRVMPVAWAPGVGSSIGWIVGSGSDAARNLLGTPPGRCDAPPPRASRTGAQTAFRDSPPRTLRVTTLGTITGERSP